MPKDEGSLVEDAIKGDRDAFVSLVKTHQQRIFALSCSLVGDYHLAQDAAQETFLRAFKAVKTLKDPEKFGSWLAGIAYRVSKEFRRGEAKDAAFKPGYPDDLSFLVKDGVETDVQETMFDAVNSLTDDARAILALKYIEGLSYDQMAELLEIEPKTVKSRLFSARKLLREKFGSFRPK